MGIGPGSTVQVLLQAKGGTSVAELTHTPCKTNTESVKSSDVPQCHHILQLNIILLYNRLFLCVKPFTLFLLLQRRLCLQRRTRIQALQLQMVRCLTSVVFLFGFPTYGVGYFLLFIYLLFNDALGLRSCADVQCPFNLFSSIFHSIIIQRSQKAERQLYIQQTNAILNLCNFAHRAFVT